MTDPVEPTPTSESTSEFVELPSWVHDERRHVTIREEDTRGDANRAALRAIELGQGHNLPVLRAETLTGPGGLLESADDETKRYVQALVDAHNERVTSRREKSRVATSTTFGRRMRNRRSPDVTVYQGELEHTHPLFRRTDAGVFWDDTNHPINRRVEQLELAREQYARTRRAKGKPWSKHATKLFFGRNKLEEDEDPETIALTPHEEFIDPSLSRLQDTVLEPRLDRTTDATPITDPTELQVHERVLDGLIQRLVGRAREVEQQRTDIKERRSQLKKGLRFKPHSETEPLCEDHKRCKGYLPIQTRGEFEDEQKFLNEWSESIKGIDTPETIRSPLYRRNLGLSLEDYFKTEQGQEHYKQARQELIDESQEPPKLSDTERRNREKEWQLGIVRANGDIADTSFTLGDLMGRYAHLRLPDGSHISETSTGEHIAPLSQVVKGHEILKPIIAQQLLKLERDPSFNASFKLQNGKVDVNSDANRTIADAQRRVVKKTVDHLQNIAYDLFHKNGFIYDHDLDTPIQIVGDEFLPLHLRRGQEDSSGERSFRPSRRLHEDRAIVLDGGKTLVRAGHVALSSDPQDRELYSPRRVQFDKQGRVTNPDEARLTDEERDRATINGTYYPSLNITPTMSNFAEKLSKAFNLSKSVKRQLQTVRVNNSLRSLISSENPLDLITSGDYSSFLNSEHESGLQKQDPDLHKALEDNVEFYTSPPESRGVSEELTDQIVHRIISRKEIRLSDTIQKTGLEKLKSAVSSLRDLTKKDKKPSKTIVRVPDSSSDILTDMTSYNSEPTLNLTQEDHELLQKHIQHAQQHLDYISPKILESLRDETSWNGREADEIRRPLVQFQNRINDLRESINPATINIVDSSKLTDVDREASKRLKSVFGTADFMPSQYRFDPEQEVVKKSSSTNYTKTRRGSKTQLRATQKENNVQ